MLKIIKVKLERNLIDFKKGKSFYLKRNTGSEQGHFQSKCPPLINKENSD